LRYTALPKIIAPKLRKRREVEVNAAVIDRMIELGPVEMAEDVDPDLAINPVAVEMLRQEKLKAKRKEEKERLKRAEQKAMRGKEMAHAANAAAAAGGAPPAVGRKGNALRKLGLQMSNPMLRVRRRASSLLGGEEGPKGLKQLDAHINKQAEAARRAQAQYAAVDVADVDASLAFAEEEGIEGLEI